MPTPPSPPAPRPGPGSILRIETSLERRGRPGWKELLPKEHGVWGWLGVPLTAAVVSGFAAGVGVGLATLAAALACVAGLGSAQGLARVMSGAQAARVPAAVALFVAFVLGAIAVHTTARPGVLVLTLGAGAVLGFGVMALTRGRLPRQPLAEVGGIAAFCALGAGLGLASGLPLEHVLVTALAVFAWLVIGLWWVKGQLAAVLSNRAPWHAGLVVAAVAAAASLALGVALGRSLAGALPLFYPARAMLHAAPRSGRDVKRVGLVELAWGLVVAVLAALV